MGRKRLTAEQIIAKLREAEVELAKGQPWVDFQRTGGSRDRPCSRYYHPNEFEILAACLHPVTARWEYRFRGTSTMDRGPKPECPDHLFHRPRVEGPDWAEHLDQLLDEITT